MPNARELNLHANQTDLEEKTDPPTLAHVSKTIQKPKKLAFDDTQHRDWWGGMRN